MFGKEDDVCTYIPCRKKHIFGISSKMKHLLTKECFRWLINFPVRTTRKPCQQDSCNSNSFSFVVYLLKNTTWNAHTLGKGFQRWCRMTDACFPIKAICSHCEETQHSQVTFCILMPRNALISIFWIWFMVIRDNLHCLILGLILRCLQLYGLYKYIMNSTSSFCCIPIKTPL